MSKKMVGANKFSSHLRGGGGAERNFFWAYFRNVLGLMVGGCNITISKDGGCNCKRWWVQNHHLKRWWVQCTRCTHPSYTPVHKQLFKRIEKKTDKGRNNISEIKTNHYLDGKSILYLMSYFVIVELSLHRTPMGVLCKSNTTIIQLQLNN